MSTYRSAPRRPTARNRGGFSLVIVIVIGLILTAVALAFIARSTTDSALVTRNRETSRTDILVDAGLARARSRLTNAFQTINANRNLRPAVCTLWGIAACNNTTSSLPLMLAADADNAESYCPGDDERAQVASIQRNGTVCSPTAREPYYEFVAAGADGVQRRVRYTIEEWPLNDPNRPSPFRFNCVGSPVRGWCASGVRGVVMLFRLTAALDVPGERNVPWSGAQQFVLVSRTFLNQYAVLYNNELEIAPGSTLTIGGAIHSNANIYLANNGIRLAHTFDPNAFASCSASGSDPTRCFNPGDTPITATGNIFRGRAVSNGGDNGTNTSPRVDNASGSAVNLSASNNSVNTFSGFNNFDLTNPDKECQVGLTASQCGSGKTWQVKSDYNTASNSQNVDGRLKNKQATVNLPGAADLDPSSPNNVFLNLINNPTSDRTASGGLIIRTRDDATASSLNSTLISKDGAPIAIIVPQIEPIAGNPTNVVYREYAVNADGSRGVERTGNQKYFPDGTFRQADFYNGREGPTMGNINVKVTDIDVNLLGQATIKNSQGQSLGNIYPESGLVYATRDDAVADGERAGQPGCVTAPSDATPDPCRRPFGFRLRNGATLPGNGLTFVSPEPTYIQGDFNRHQNCSTTPCSRVDPNSPSYNPAGDTWKQAAVLTDAITILSNSWQDGNNRNSSRSLQGASNTEVNAVLASGITRSFVNSDGSGNYNGGLENFPRLLENWGNNSSLRIRGSLLQVWYSRFATGRWNTSGNSYYGVPNGSNGVPGRDWGYDTSFLRNPDPIISERFPGPVTIGGIVGNPGRYISTVRLTLQQFQNLGLNWP